MKFPAVLRKFHVLPKDHQPGRGRAQLTGERGVLPDGAFNLVLEIVSRHVGRSLT